MNDGRAYDEHLPWLQPVDDEDEPRGVSGTKMFAWIAIILLAAAIVAGAFFWLGRSDTGANGPPELIRAPASPYKIKPPNPGGLDIAGESETAFETSAGQDTDAQLDLNALPETAVAKPPKDEPKHIPPNETKEPVAAEAPPAPQLSAPTGSVVQLGAFQNQAQAERAWTALSSRFPAVAAATKLIVPFSGGIRLRASTASPADAKQVCQTLKAAGENCFVAQ
jgi:hypothetical protein